MKGITYFLGNCETDVLRYYSAADTTGHKLINSIKLDNEKYIEDYMLFIEENSVENTRSWHEYMLEIVLIGIFKKEYMKYAYEYKGSRGRILRLLDRFRRIKGVKGYCDAVKGRILSSLSPAKDISQRYTAAEELNILIRWMDDLGDFKEEMYRIKNWYLFLMTKSQEYVEDFIASAQVTVEKLQEVGDRYLYRYVEGLDSFLEDCREVYRGREDLFYCSRSRIQYYFNIVGSEIMNEIYEKEFCRTHEKMILMPGCMRQNEEKCRSVDTDKGKRCCKCNSNCNVNKVTVKAETYKAEAYVIEHETSLFGFRDIREKKVGVVGIACVLNLMSGGWKALRLGFIPQCVVINCCGCHHWLQKPIMTEISIRRLERILNKCNER